MTEEESKNLIFKLGLLILLGMVIQLGVIAYVIWAQYDGRKNSVENLRAGCRRGKMDRADNAQIASAAANNWREAAAIRRKDGDITVAIKYTANAKRQEASSRSLAKRSRINCADAYPKASLLR